MKTSKLSGAALDWAVARCEGIHLIADFEQYKPSESWVVGGPIIEREGIALKRIIDGWRATRDWIRYDFIAPTPLIAAMRCYVASKLGEEVEVPEGLTI